MHLHDFALIAMAFASEVVGTLSGFGSSTFFVPLAVLIESFKFVLALTAILHCFGNLFKILLFRDGFQWSIFLRLAIPSLIFTGVGAFVVEWLPVEFLTRALGVMLILLSFASLMTKPKMHRLPSWLATLLAATSGFATGLVGTGGALRGIALAILQVPKNSFVTISAAIDMGGDLLRAVIYLQNGFMDWSQWFYIPLLTVAALMGTLCGKQILNHIHQSQFEKIVAGFVFLSGALMVFQA